MEPSWKSKRDHLCVLIRKISEGYGGDDREWLREYAKDVIKKYSTQLDEAIDCFDSLLPRKVVLCGNQPNDIGMALMPCTATVVSP